MHLPLAALAFAVVAAVAPAGVPLTAPDGQRYGWDLDLPAPNVVDGEVTFYVDPNGTRDGVTGPVTAQNAVRQGIANWEIGTSRLRFAEDTTRPASGRNGGDRVNWVGWVSDGLSAGTFAATFPTRDGTRLLDADVLFNDSAFQWDTRTPGVLGKADVEGLMTHEWGHAIGADHVPLRLSSMYAFSRAGSIRERSLSDDDRALIGAMYPNQTYSQTTGDLSGTVSNVDTNDDRAIHVIAVSVFTAEPAGSTLTDPDGSYTIEGLPAGGYRILAAPTRPLKGSMNAFWESGSNSFLPAFLGDTDSNPTQVRTVTVAAGQTTQVDAFTVGNKSSPFENDDDLAHATDIALGDGIAARFESRTDVDVFAFQGTADEIISISVLSYGIGSDGDPRVELLDDAGFVLASNADIRAPTLFQTRIEGEDLDARLLGVPLTQTGGYFVRVSNDAAESSSSAYYGLLVTAASEAPSASLTTISADPLRIDADGTSTSTLTIHPRKETGEDVGAGASVTLVHDGAGTAPGTAVDLSDGTYEATVTAPLTPGLDRFSVTIATADGVATLTDALVLVYLGPPSDASSITTTPRRIAADGLAQSVVQLVPRDAAGEMLGSGRQVAFDLTGPPGAGLFGVSDQGDGSYADVLTGGTTEGAAVIAMTVDGITLTATATIQLGFPLVDVLAQARADVGGFLTNDALSRRAIRTLGSADKVLGKAELDAPSPAATREEKRAVRRTRSAVNKLLKARKRAKGALDELGTELELANAVRQAAQAAIDRANVVTGKHQRRLDSARTRLGTGDAFREAGDVKKAAANYLRAYFKAFTLSP